MTAVLTDNCKNALLNSAATNGLVTSGTHLALFTTFPPTIGTNEATGGSPAYARKAITFTANAATGSISPSSGLSATFDVPATTVRAVGVCTALTAGSLLCWSPAGASARRAFTVPDATAVTADLLYSPAHGLVANDRVLLWPTIGAALPTGLAEDTEYFVISTGLTTDAFSVSATQGGSAVNVTAIGDGDVQKYTAEVFAAQGQYVVTNYTVSLPG